MYYLTWWGCLFILFIWGIFQFLFWVHQCLNYFHFNCADAQFSAVKEKMKRKTFLYYLLINEICTLCRLANWNHQLEVMVMIFIQQTMNFENYDELKLILISIYTQCNFYFLFSFGDLKNNFQSDVTQTNKIDLYCLLGFRLMEKVHFIFFQIR